MNFFETTLRRRILFACLYLSEGAPIGFLWLAMPTRLRASGVPIEQITWLTAILVLPWTFKFAWAPLVDVLRTRWWTLRHWIVAAQLIMGATLLPLIWLDPIDQFQTMTWLLLAHALSAATQDVSIDALCISATAPQERGQYNGWMQAGMLLGRSMMGGGALVLAAYIGDAAIIVLLVMLTTFSMSLVVMSRPPQIVAAQDGGRVKHLGREVWAALQEKTTWLGLLFAAVGGAAFKSLEVIYGPFLVDRGFNNETIGWFSLGPMIGAMICGSILGGWLADRIAVHRCVAGSLGFISITIMGLAATDWLGDATGSWQLFVWLVATAIGIGLFTASSYAMFMNITRPALAATQFSAFMGATNGCESWSSYATGRIIASSGYPTAMLSMCLVSLCSLPLVVMLRVSSRAKSNPQIE